MNPNPPKKSSNLDNLQKSGSHDCHDCSSIRNVKFWQLMQFCCCMCKNEQDHWKAIVSEMKLMTRQVLMLSPNTNLKSFYQFFAAWKTFLRKSAERLNFCGTSWSPPFPSWHSGTNNLADCCARFFLEDQTSTLSRKSSFWKMQNIYCCWREYGPLRLRKSLISGYEHLVE